MELEDRNPPLEQRGNKADIPKKDRHVCPECGKRCAIIVRDKEDECMARFICKECYDRLHGEGK